MNDHPKTLRRLLKEFISHSGNTKTSVQKDLVFIRQLQTTLFVDWGVKISTEKLQSGFHMNELEQIVERDLKRDSFGRTIVDLFSHIEVIAKRELHDSISLRWYSEWVEYENVGNWLTKPDSLDFVEMFMSIREEMNIETKELLDFGVTVRETVLSVWNVVQNR